jgi:lipid A 3-O-deacylase
MMRGSWPFATPPLERSRAVGEVFPSKGVAHMRAMKAMAFLALLLALAAVPAQAGLSELRLGLLDHDIGILGHAKEGGGDINGEVLFESPGFLDAVGAPRPHLGVSVNSEGDTSQAYAGLTWGFAPVQLVFMEFSLGGAIHDGKLSDGGTARKELGARVLFRESLSLGYRIDDHHSLSLIFDHESNANLADHNEGLNNLGIRWGYRF